MRVVAGLIALVVAAGCEDPAFVTVTVTNQRPDLEAIQLRVLRIDSIDTEVEVVDCTFEVDGTRDGKCGFEESRTQWVGGGVLKAVLYGGLDTDVAVVAAGWAGGRQVVVARGESRLAVAGGDLEVALKPQTQANQSCSLDVNPDADPKGGQILSDPQDLSALALVDEDADGRLEILAALGTKVFVLDYREAPELEGGCGLDIDRVLIEGCTVRANHIVVGNIDGVEGEDVAVFCGGRVGGMAAPYDLHMFGHAHAELHGVLPIDRTSRPVLGDFDGDGLHEIAAVSADTQTPPSHILHRFDMLTTPPTHQSTPVMGSGAAPNTPPASHAPLVVPGPERDALYIVGYQPEWTVFDPGASPHNAGPVGRVVTGLSAARYPDGTPAITAAATAMMRSHVSLNTISDRVHSTRLTVPMTVRVQTRIDVHLPIGDIHGAGEASVVAVTGQTLVSAPFRPGVGGEAVRAQSLSGSDPELKASLLVDIDGEPGAEIISYFVSNNELTIMRSDGTVFEGWPVTIESEGDLRVAVADLDGDTSAEIVVVAFPRVFVFSLGGGSYGAAPWAFPVGDRRGTGFSN